jgi:hypothetical protein
MSKTKREHVQQIEIYGQGHTPLLTRKYKTSLTCSNSAHTKSAVFDANGPSASFLLNDGARRWLNLVHPFQFRSIFAANFPRLGGN